jgi:hypothetical protein
VSPTYTESNTGDTTNSCVGPESDTPTQASAPAARTSRADEYRFIAVSRRR